MITKTDTFRERLLLVYHYAGYYWVWIVDQEAAKVNFAASGPAYRQKGKISGGFFRFLIYFLLVGGRR